MDTFAELYLLIFCNKLQRSEWKETQNELWDLSQSFLDLKKTAISFYVNRMAWSDKLRLKTPLYSAAARHKPINKSQNDRKQPEKIMPFLLGLYKATLYYYRDPIECGTLYPFETLL